VEFARGLKCELADANSECGIRNDEVTGLMGQLVAAADALNHPMLPTSMIANKQLAEDAAVLICVK